jgi:hypothetical protein
MTNPFHHEQTRRPSLTLNADRKIQELSQTPDVGQHMLRQLGSEQARFRLGQRHRQQQLIDQMWIDRRAATVMAQQSLASYLSNTFGW